MAITQNELNIANTSYTNKDFEAIYTELLTLAKKISYRFDPTSSSESDPFVMLLKLLAFVGDKVNYNIDKNILERFLLSATQEKSVRELTDMLGYHMHYYEAATTNVIFKVKEVKSEDVVLPRFTILTNETNDVAYVTTSNITIPAGSFESTQVEAIQGTLHDFTVLGSTNITLDNLDADYRLYFPELMVAQNGVFIEGGTNLSTQLNIWELSNNLNTEDYGSKRFMFGFDSKQNLPYIQFPEWINAIIGEGLTIKYLTTSGVDGNIQVKTLKNISTSITLPDDISVINASAALNGKDPETIDEAYQGFKKTVGTFDTLVTCRDYANYIYEELLDTSNNPCVSNIQVSDRRTDFNYTTNVVTFTGLGEQVVHTADSTTTPIQAYDLCLYPLQKVADTEFTYKGKAENYNKSFKPSDTPDVEYIKSQLEDTVECLSHNYKDLQNEDLYAIKNYYKITALVSTFNKVSSSEQMEILEKINQKLTTTFNARSVDFGYELPFDKVKQCMMDADSRISDVILYPFEVTPKVMLKNGTEWGLSDTTGSSGNKFNVIVAKNVLAGKIEAFKYFDAFELGYDTAAALNPTAAPTGGSYYTKMYDEADYIMSISSYSNIQGINNQQNYTLKDNEVVQFISPNYYTKNVYPYGINYNLVLSNTRGAGLNEKINANTEFKLITGEQFIVEWRDSTTKQNTGRTYGPGSIIKPNVALYTTEYRKAHSETPITKTFTDEDGNTYINLEMFQLGTNEQVEDRFINQIEIENTCKCYWYLNNDNNQIPWSNNEYLLQDGEYFFCADLNMTRLSPGPFGSGTTLKRSVNTILNDQLEKVSDISAIVEEGLDYLKNYFITVPFDSNKKLILTENEIVTLTSGYNIAVSGSNDLTIPDNSWSSSIPSTVVITYGIPGTTTSTLTKGKEWKVRALLDINAGPELDQWLYSNALDPDPASIKNTHQIKITLGSYNASTGTWTQGSSYYLSGRVGSDTANINMFKFNTLIQKMGGTNISLKYIDLTCDKKDNVNYPQLCYFRAPKQATQYNVYNNDPNYYVTTLAASGTLTLKTPGISSRYKDLVMVYVEDDNKISFSNGYISGAGYETNNVLKSGVHIMQASQPSPGSAYRISLSNTDSSASHTVVFSKLRIVDVGTTGYYCNPKLALPQGAVTGFPSFINILKGSDRTGAVEKANLLTFNDNTRLISLAGDQTLKSPEAFWQANNVANKWSIPEIDFSTSSITINPSCKK